MKGKGTMSRAYDLWDVEAGNRIGTYATELQALTVVRDLIAANEPGYAEGLSLALHDGQGNGELVAEGYQLAELAWVREANSATSARFYTPKIAGGLAELNYHTGGSSPVEIRTREVVGSPLVPAGRQSGVGCA